MNITIQDVAARAGVSIKTVSRVVNAEPNVRDSTRQRVQEAIRQLKYQPNPAARRLASNRSYLVGLFLDSALSETSYIAEIATGVLARCRQERYDLVIHPYDYHLKGTSGLSSEIIEHVQQSRIDGAIVTPPLADLNVVTETLEQLEKPYVRISPGRFDIGSACVHTHDRRAAYGMTKHLIDLGHKRIAFLDGPRDHLAMSERRDGFLQAMEEAGYPTDDSFIRGWPVIEERRAARFEGSRQVSFSLLSQPLPPTAIFACTDEMAAGVLSAAHEMNLKIPQQLSVAGFDNSLLSLQVWPKLTTVHQPCQEMASTATELLLNQLSNRKTSVREVALETRLIVRDSTGPAPRE